MNPRIRTGLTHLGSVTAGGVAAIGFMSSHSVDLYAAWNQLNVAIAEITKFLAIITPLATAGYGMYKAGTKQKLEDIIADPKAVEVAKEIPPSPAVIAVAEALKTNGH